MTDRVDCLVFEDQLDAFVRGDLSQEGERQLRAHAATCEACATLARLGAHLASPSLQALEDRVPDGWVASMGPNVEAALRERGGGTARRRRWLVPTLAAASVALLLSTGMAVRALDRAGDRERVLVGQLIDMQRRMVAQGVAPARTERGSRSAVQRNASLRSLADAGDVTVAELRALLQALPSGTPVVGGSQRATLASSRLVPAAWREVLVRLEPGADITVGDLLGLLDELDLPSEATVPTGRLFELLS